MAAHFLIWENNVFTDVKKCHEMQPTSAIGQPIFISALPYKSLSEKRGSLST